MERKRRFWQVHPPTHIFWTLPGAFIQCWDWSYFAPGVLQKNGTRVGLLPAHPPAKPSSREQLPRADHSDRVRLRVSALIRMARVLSPNGIAKRKNTFCGKRGKIPFRGTWVGLGRRDSWFGTMLTLKGRPVSKNSLQIGKANHDVCLKRHIQIQGILVFCHIRVSSMAPVCLPRTKQSLICSSESRITQTPVLGNMSLSVPF